MPQRGAYGDDPALLSAPGRLPPYLDLRYRPELSPGRAWAYTLVVFRSACPSVADTRVMGAPLSFAPGRTAINGRVSIWIKPGART